MNAVLELKGQKIAAFDEFRSQLAELEQHNKSVVFDYESPAGNKEARSHVYKLRQTRSAVERARKEQKQVALDYGRKVDNEAREISDQISDMIEVHEKPIREIEQREKDRVARHEANLDEIAEAGRRASEQWLDLPLEAMRERLKEIESDDPLTEEYWEEYLTAAKRAKDASLAQIRDAIARREKHEAEQAELIRLREEAAERERKDREAKVAQEAEARAKAEAEAQRERDRAEAEAKAKAEREAAERRELELKLEKERAEKAALEAEERARKAEQEAAEKAQREADEKARREREEAEKRESDRKHRAKINNAAVAAFVKGGLTDDAAKLAVELIAKRTVPAVTISY